MPRRRYVIIEAPSSLGLTTEGVEELPTRFRELQLAERIGAHRVQRLIVPSKDPTRDTDTQVLNARAIASWSVELADALGAALEAREFPVVLGGDCTIVLGTMLGLRRRGRHGLAFIDGNADYFQPESDPKGEGASMDLAFVTGRGPAMLTDLEGRGPLVRPEDAVAIGFRDIEDQAEYGSPPLPDAMLAYDLDAVRRLGVEEVARKALERLTRSMLNGFLIHVDADCLDDGIMPAVDFRVPGGLSGDELSALLRHLLTSDKALGIEITIYNPHLDRDGSAGRYLVDLLANVLRN